MNDDDPASFEGESDYCEIPLSDIRDEGPLVAAAGYLTVACAGTQVGQCGPHAALPTLYSLRFCIELTFHGATQALEEGRGCDGRTEQKTHILTALFDTWKMNLQHSSNRLKFYNGQIPDNSDLGLLLDKFHQLDPEGTHLRYPVKFPDFANVCDAIEDACKFVHMVVDRTTPLVPKSKKECLRRLSFLKAIADDPCHCVTFADFQTIDNLVLPTSGTWPTSWPIQGN